MPFRFLHEDITKMETDAIVCPTDPLFSGSGGTDMKIHRAAGKELDEACSKLGMLEPGKAAITEGYGLQAGYVIHTVGPVWEGGNAGERETLYSCYINCLSLARDRGCVSVALPLVSSGTFGFPVDEDIKITQKAVTDFLVENDGDMFIDILVYSKPAYDLAKKLGNVEESICSEEDFAEEACYDSMAPDVVVKERRSAAGSVCCESRMSFFVPEEIPEGCGKGFSDTLMELIDKRGLKDSECYTRSNISRKLFSKIRSNPDYHPEKRTVFAFAIGLGLSMEETERLLQSAGYAFCYAGSMGKLDRAVRYFIENGVRDIWDAEMILYENDLPRLGEKMT